MAFHIVDMDMLAGLDGAGRNADVLTVLDHGLALGAKNMIFLDCYL